MNPKFYVEIQNESDDTSNSSYSPPMKKLYEPLDLSRRDSVETTKTPSLYSDGTKSRNSSHPEDMSPSYSDEKRNTSSPDSAYNESSQIIWTPYMMHAAALQHRLSQFAQSTTGDSSENDSSSNKQSVQRDGTSSRQFKANPDNPISLPVSLPISASDDETAEKFLKYRLKMLEHIRGERGGVPIKSNPKMRRSGHKLERTNVAENEVIINNLDSSVSGVKDKAYYERREKNNAAAKKSRERRRIKEDEIAIKAAFLENQNIVIKTELSAAKQEADALRIKLSFLQSQLAIHCKPACAKNMGGYVASANS